MIVTSKRPASYFAGRAAYANGLLVGHIHQKSDHFRGKETNKRLMFVPVEGLPYRLPTLVEPGWTLRHIHQRIEDEIRLRYEAQGATKTQAAE